VIWILAPCDTCYGVSTFLRYSGNHLHYFTLSQPRTSWSTKMNTNLVTLQLTVGRSVGQSVRLGIEPLWNSWPDVDCNEDSCIFCLSRGVLPVERTGLSYNRSQSLSGRQAVMLLLTVSRSVSPSVLASSPRLGLMAICQLLGDIYVFFVMGCQSWRVDGSVL